MSLPKTYFAFKELGASEKTAGSILLLSLTVSKHHHLTCKNEREKHR